MTTNTPIAPRTGDAYPATTPVWAETIRDLDDNAIAGTDLDSAVLDVVELPDETNSLRTAQDVLGAGTGTNDCTFDASGNFVWYLQASDTPTPAVGAEPRIFRATLTYTWTASSITYTQKLRLEYRVQR